MFEKLTSNCLASLE
ncbi:UNVERIFIED_CONTAM: hypothetical protein GTU68_059265 [Idotea baltica]|nr:hypothetical protein [Idotea baltica]